MKITHIDPTGFKSARINILATSDNHGQLTTLPQFYKAVEQNKQDIFKKADEKSTLNLFINSGDFFINPSKRGYLTSPSATSGIIQRDFLKRLIKDIKGLLPEDARFKALYTPGNHCFDGGDNTFFELMKVPGMTTVVSNIDRNDQSHILKRIKPTILQSKEYVVPDSDDPDYKYRIMYIGATIPTMKFYNPGLVNKIAFLDDVEKKDAQLKEEDLKNTFDALNKLVVPFKKRHPDGVVLLGCHMGTDISEMVQKRVPGIDEIFDAHKHSCSTITKEGTTISSLGEDNEIVKSISLKLEKKDRAEIDKKIAALVAKTATAGGKISHKQMEELSKLVSERNKGYERITNTYFTDDYKLDALETNGLNDMLKSVFVKDNAPLVQLIDRKNELTSLHYSGDIRYANSYLANFLTSTIRDSIAKKHPEIDVVGIQSSIIRGGLENGSNNLVLMKVLDGVSEDLSDVHMGPVSGANLIGMIVENIAANLKSKTRNTIIHWSDIQVNRQMIAELLENGYYKPEDFKEAVKIRSKIKKNDFEKIDLKTDYNVAIAAKYLVKDDIEFPSIIRHSFQPLGKTYDALLREELEQHDYNVLINDETKEKRII